LKTQKGNISPLGFSFFENLLNFSIHAPLANKVNLIIFDENGTQIDSFNLYQTKNRFHICLINPPAPLIYQYELHQGKKTVLICDPFSPFSTSSTIWGEENYNKNLVKSIAQNSPPFD